ncbi:hypothetical protein Bhyg_05360 [Pseudolycoriella hygida]|uniref:Uncharacterized protein n=1 Tax=Pseudolycoriella hygida TaxID=35572 RepID=A0A9Q0NHV6_9DIPT|nr:hypothetical protein Bhyg_05360 [Pseudolycoriella hygida]
MYEVAQVAGNKVEAACALQSLSNIMGQLSSSHQGGKTNPSKIFPRHSSSTVSASTAPTCRDHFQIQIRDSRNTKEVVMNSNGQVRVSDRPITISEMNAYNVEKSEAISGISQNKEFYTVGEGYHKTDSCYYKTPDGGFHKLPPDSYHKMSEICYTKLPDGSFCRIDELNGSNANPTHSNGSHHKVRNQMIKFLKRSKSHTPATIKEIQKAKEKEKEHRQESNGNTNRKVVVTMMENGGLPIVAKARRERIEKSHNHKDHRSSTNKDDILKWKRMMFRTEKKKQLNSRDVTLWLQNLRAANLKKNKIKIGDCC